MGRIIDPERRGFGKAICDPPTTHVRARSDIGRLGTRCDTRSLLLFYQHRANAPHYELNRGSQARSEEHTSELQPLMRISYAFFCLNTKLTLIHIAKTAQQHSNDTGLNRFI